MKVGVDTGGTFTDFVCWDGKKWIYLKIPSTPQNPAEAVLKGLGQLGGEENLDVVHGTTVATNTLLERKGAKTAIVTNRGFEDVIEIGRQNREELYNLHYKRPEPLVPRGLRFGLSCRINYKGEILEDLKEEELDELLKNLKEEGVESVAVCFLHSYTNPEHEERVGEFLKNQGGFFVSLSHEVVSEFREYERFSTTVVNAYVSPKMASYLSFLKEKLGKNRLSIMQSNGGIISPEKASEEAVRTILSGPAGGVVGASYVGKLAGFNKLITFDMGGTSTDVSLVDGRPRVTSEGKVAGFPVKIPMIEIHTVGAGGGSIAYLDEGGALRVGPRSAGALPGPVCYGRGGKDITVTDANLYLGRLSSEHFLGGKMKLFPELVEKRMKEFSRKVGLSPEELAEGIITVVNSNMEKALRKVSVERGYDPSEFTLISFGGAGGLHCVELAQSLKIPRVLVPKNPGLLSALGLVVADRVKEFSLTVMLEEEEASPEVLEEIYSLLKERMLEELEREGLEEEIIFEKLLDVRYKGQSYEITVPLFPDFRNNFEREHRKLYGYVHEGRPLEIVNLRLRSIGTTKKPPLEEVEAGNNLPPPEAFLGEREVFYKGAKEKFYLIDREKLKGGNRIDFPAIILEYSSTTFIPPGYEAEVDKYGNIVIYL